MLIKENQLQTNIKLFGYMNYFEAMQIVCQSKIGLCLLKPINNYIESYPTKLFDYMQAGVPYVCSNFPLYQKLLDTCEAGIAVDPLNFEEIINAINNLMEDSDLYTNLSNNGNIALVKISIGLHKKANYLNYFNLYNHGFSRNNFFGLALA